MADATLTAVLELRDQMSAGLAKANESLKKMADATTATGQKMQQTSKQIATFSSSMKNVAGNIAHATGLANLFSLGAMIHWFKQAIGESIKFASELDHLSSSMGIAIEALQKYTFAAEMGNVSTSELQVAMKTLQIQARAAADGGIEANAAFLRLGINLKNNKELLDDNEALFRAVIDGLSEVTVKSERTAVGSEILGRGFSRMTEFVEGGTKAIDEYGNVLKSVDGVIKEDTIKSVDALEKQLNLLEAAWMSLKVNMSSAAVEGGAIPMLTRSLGYLGAAVRLVWGILQQLAAFFIQGWASAIDIAIESVKDLVEVIKLAGGVMADFFSGDWQAAADKADQVWERVRNAPGQLADRIKYQSKFIIDNFNTINEETGKSMDAMVNGADKVAKATENIAISAKKNLPEVSKQYRNVWASMMGPTDKKAVNPDDLLAEMDQAVRDQRAGIKQGDDFETIKRKLKALKELDDQEEQLAKKRMERAKLMNPADGWNAALEKMQDGMMTFQDVFLRVFDMMESTFSSAIEKMLTKGGSFKDKMKEVFNDLKRSFIKLVADMAAQQLMASIFGLSGGSFLGGGAAAGGMGGGQAALGLGASSMAGSSALGGQAAGGAGGLSGLLGMSPLAMLGAGAGMIGVGAAATGAMGPNIGKNMGLGALSGAIAGASIAGPIGALVGAGVGGIAGFFGGKKAKKKAKKAKAEAARIAAALEAERQAQIKKARELIKTHINTTMGGGLASTQGADEVSALLAGDISVEEINKFGGADSVVARQAEIQNLAGNVQVASPVVNISVGSIANTYDVDRLTQDIGFLLGANLRTGLSSGA